MSTLSRYHRLDFHWNGLIGFALAVQGAKNHPSRFIQCNLSHCHSITVVMPTNSCQWQGSLRPWAKFLPSARDMAHSPLYPLPVAMARLWTGRGLLSNHSMTRVPIGDPSATWIKPSAQLIQKSLPSRQSRTSGVP